MGDLVCNMNYEELADLINDVLIKREENNKKNCKYKDREIGNFTVEQFTEIMVSVMETKAYLAAEREAEITKKIFKDVDQLIVGGITPFRIRNSTDVNTFVSGMSAYFDTYKGKGSFIVAAALLQEDET